MHKGRQHKSSYNNKKKQTAIIIKKSPVIKLNTKCTLKKYITSFYSGNRILSTTIGFGILLKFVSLNTQNSTVY